MKKKIFGFVSLTLALIMFLSTPVQTAFALTSDNQVIDVVYESPETITAVEQQDQQFIISTKTKSGKINNFYITFPEDGGVRFCADESGIFKPEKLSEIKYSGEKYKNGTRAVVMQANDTKVKLYHEVNPWRMEVFNSENEKVVEYSADRIWLGYDKENKLRKVKIASTIDEDETLFGLGERFNGFVQNGKTVEMWNLDSLKQLSREYGDHNVGYKNIPLLHSNQGYSIFHNSTYYGIVDVGESNAKECSFEFYGPILDMYIWTGNSNENITQYHNLTGEAIEVPKWALSYWAGQSSTIWLSEGKDKETVRDTVFSRLEKYEELNTPIKNIYAEGIAAKLDYLDIVKEMKEKGIHTFGWMDSTYRTHDTAVTADEISEKAFGTKDDNRPLVQWNDAKLASWWTADGAKWVDYTSSLSAVWLRERFKPYLESGVYGMMVDYNDNVAVETYYAGNGGTGDWMHNFSCYYYNKAVNEIFKEYYGEGEYINFARAACAGSHTYTAVFAGDQTADFMGFKQVVSALLSSAASGIHIWGSDIGGMHSSETASRYEPEVYARWLAFGTFSPLMRTHAQRDWVDPWEYDKNGSSTELFQKYYWTRENIVDLVYSGTIKVKHESVPMTQAMVLAYPEQSELATNDTQYLFCDQLLVCPVTEEGASSVDVQFPEGRWVNLWDGTAYEGGKTINVPAPMDTIPVFVKEGGAFPVLYGEDLDIGTVNTVNKNVNALIVTPTEAKVENTYYVEEDKTETYVCDMSSKETYCITTEEESDKKVVTAMGAVADKVTVDGKELKELTVKPTSAANETGFYKDYENKSTIIVTDGSWKEIGYNNTQEELENYALKGEVKVEGLELGEDEKEGNINDGSYNTTLTVTEDEEVKVVLDLKKQRTINKVSVAWTGYYARSYVMEASTDGKNWTTIYEKKKGGGGTDTVLLDEELQCRYIRLSNFDKQGRRDPEIAEIEVYGSTTQQVSADSQSIMWMGFVVGGVVLVAIATTIIIVIYKKKKR